jgi:ABC-type transporter Mla subunit MlaD
MIDRNDQSEFDPQAKRGLFSRFEIVPGMHRPKLVRNGAIFVAVLAFLLYAGYTKHIPLLPKGGEEVTAQFVDAANVRGGIDVRIHGVKAGKVDSIDTTGSGAGRMGVVKMRVDKDKAKLLRDDARAHIWWRTMLGRNVYIELDPGSSSRKLSGTIPAQRTTTQVEFDQALTPLDLEGRRAMRTMIRTFAQGFDKTAAREAITTLEPAARNIAPGLGALRGQRTGDLGRIARSAAKATKALATDEKALGGLINGGEITLAVTAARRADLAAMLQKAPASMRVAQSELIALRGTLDRLDPLAREMRAGARELAPAATAARPALTSLKVLLRHADPLLADLRPAFRSLRSAGRAGVPMMARLDPTIGRMNAEILPWLESKDPWSHRQVYQLIGPFFASLASITSIMDHNGHQIRFQPPLSGRVGGALTGCEEFFNDPTTQQKLVCTQFNAVLTKMLSGGGARR